MGRSILLFRHGEPTDGAHNICRGSGRDDPLSLDGEAQTLGNIAYLEDRFRDELRNALVVTSPLLRARYFGDQCRELYGAEHRIDHQLTDLFVGEWEGRTWEDIDAYWKEQSDLCKNDARSLVIPGGEPINEFIERVTTRWKYWVQQSPEKLLIFCIHKCLLKVIFDTSVDRKLTFSGQKIACMNELEVDVRGDNLRVNIREEDQKKYPQFIRQVLQPA